MRIGINTRILLDGRLEGIGLFTHEVLRRLVGLMPDDEFVFFFDRKPHEQFLYHPAIRPVVLHPQARHPLLWYLWFEWALPRAIRRHGIDLFFSPDGYDSLRIPVRSVVTVHDLAFHHFPDHLPRLVQAYMNHYTPRYVQKAGHVITVSEFSKRDICSTYGTSPQKITVVGNGCDEAIRPLLHSEKQEVRQQWTDGDPFLLYIGSVHPRKNTARLLAAYDELRTRGGEKVKLVIAGRWAWKTGEVNRVRKQMSHSADVVDTGHLSRQLLGRLLGAAECLVYPSLFEGFGIPVLEAMHAEVPVITSRNSSMSEVAGEAALYIDPLDIHSMATAMERLLNDAKLRGKLVAAGRLRREQYSWDATAAKVATCMEAFRR